MSQEKTIDAKKGDARDDRLQYIRKTQQEVRSNTSPSSALFNLSEMSVQLS